MQEILGKQDYLSYNLLQSNFAKGIYNDDCEK